jgi:hypothetical protein
MLNSWHMPIALAEQSSLKIILGKPSATAIDTGLPVLAGEQQENLFGTSQSAGRLGDLELFTADGWLLGAATMPLTAGLETAAHKLYDEIFEAAGDKHLARIWNYVPSINEAGPGGMENYRLFCRGRSLAFEQRFGRGFKARLPSASAVGHKANVLTVMFAAAARPARHFENPLQVPAYDYPTTHGPRPPSFARATVVSGSGRSAVFISGTAAIRGHETVAPYRTREQVECALDNLQEISRVCGLGSALGREGEARRHFKVYVRHAGDLPLVTARMEERLLRSSDHISYLQADICRAELLVEIEATILEPTSPRS